MVRFIKIILFFLSIACFFSQPALAKTKILTHVKVIHASTGPRYVDPGLKKIIPELKSVFKYTSYRLLKDQRLDQHFHQKDRVNLPGKRTLIIMPSDMEGKRIRYQITIKKNKRSVFQTRVLLKNNSSITIGGPQFNDGVLLFNISGSAK
ncbi:MAG: hypothetical protein DRH93_06280 [Deltaproteobacteria bacterium]|nr:MAG: hypothetical protein DRH93_06280 [Deltaproteobacteria bacterium]